MSNSKEVKQEHIVSALLTKNENIASLNKITHQEEGPLTIAETLPDPSDPIQEAEDRIDCLFLLKKLREVLSRRQYKVIAWRFVIPRTPEEITRSRKNRFQEPHNPWIIRNMTEVGLILGLSEVYVGKVERDAMKRLQAPQNLAKLRPYNEDPEPFSANNSVSATNKN